MDDNTKLNGRHLHIWRGQDLVVDINALADAIVASGAEIYNQSNRLVHLDAGKLVPVPRDQLPDIIGKHVVSGRSCTGRSSRVVVANPGGPLGPVDPTPFGPGSSCSKTISAWVTCSSIIAVGSRAASSSKGMEVGDLPGRK